MGRILAFDYGIKRTGIAVTDPGQIIATGLTVVPTSGIITYLTAYLGKEKVEQFVVGHPKHMNNTDSAVEEIIGPFVKLLHKSFPEIPVDRIDERFTSKLAFQAMIDGGLKMKERRNKETIDAVSAVLILQSYLEFIQNQKKRTV